jgi:hypothetical protein
MSNKSCKTLIYSHTRQGGRREHEGFLIQEGRSRNAGFSYKCIRLHVYRGVCFSLHTLFVPAQFDLLY